MEFSVVIPTYARPAQLRRTLGSVAACAPAPTEVIVVDGDPRRSAAGVVEEAARNGGLPISYLAYARGANRQRNAGLELASGEVVVFLDDDVVVTENVFAVLGDAYRDPSLLGATGRVIEPRVRRRWARDSPLRRLLPGGGREGGFTRFGFQRYVTRVEDEFDVEFMVGCFTSARRDVAEAVRFDEELVAPGEDVDFSFRLSRLGRIRYLPRAVVYHDKRGFRSRDRRLHDRRLVHNWIYLFRKNCEQTPLARAQFALSLGMLLVHRLVNRDLRGARGLLDGIREAWRERR
jgi:GT2 family glycosyltransferase